MPGQGNSETIRTTKPETKNNSQLTAMQQLEVFPGICNVSNNSSFINYQSKRNMDNNSWRLNKESGITRSKFLDPQGLLNTLHGRVCCSRSILLRGYEVFGLKLKQGNREDAKKPLMIKIVPIVDFGLSLNLG